MEIVRLVDEQGRRLPSSTDQVEIRPTESPGVRKLTDRNLILGPMTWTPTAGECRLRTC
jgi:hypothetical protein